MSPPPGFASAVACIQGSPIRWRTAEHLWVNGGFHLNRTGHIRNKLTRWARTPPHHSFCTAAYILVITLTTLIFSPALQPMSRYHCALHTKWDDRKQSWICPSLLSYREKLVCVTKSGQKKKKKKTPTFSFQILFHKPALCIKIH